MQFQCVINVTNFAVIFSLLKFYVIRLLFMTCGIICIFRYIVCTKHISMYVFYTVKRLIHIWRKVNLQDLKKECLSFQQQFLNRYNEQSSVTDMWVEIKTTLLSLTSKHVPSKMTSSRFNHICYKNDLLEKRNVPSDEPALLVSFKISRSTRNFKNQLKQPVNGPSITLSPIS